MTLSDILNPEIELYDAESSDSFPIIISNSQKFKCFILFWNEDSQCILNNTALRELQIIDRLDNWYGSTGYIVIDDKMETFEKGSEDEPGFTFRNDGRDILHIELFPISNDGEDIPEKWKIKLNFVISRIEDMDCINIVNKSKKIYFHEIRYQFLKELNIEWSTATTNYALHRPKSSKKIYNMTDEERALPLGDALQALLNDSFEYLLDDVFSTNTKFTDMENWDMCLKSKIFYSSLAQNTVVDDIEYLYNYNLFFNDDLCLLNFNNHTRMWEFKSFKNIFDKSNELQISHMYISTFGDKPSPTIKYSPDIDSSMELNLFSTIDRYFRYDMTADDNTKHIVSRPIYMTDYKNKKFRVLFGNTHIEEINDYINENFISSFQRNIKSDSYEPLNMGLNKTKFRNRNINLRFVQPTTSDIPSLIGKNDVIKKYLFLNEHILLDINGITWLSSGKIMAIESPDQSDKNYDYKVYGQWLITSVTIAIKDNILRTFVEGIKPYSSGKLNLNEDIY